MEIWEKVKRDERAQAGDASALAGIARTLPALVRAEKLGKRARDAGLDWRDIGGVIAKVREELDEAELALNAGCGREALEELGDALLALANAPRFLGESAEDSLRSACDKFVGRFERVEKLAASRGVELSSLSDQEIDTLWREAKRLGRKP
jgi:tetrapyrrole methylase family protein/MazG family protein